MDAVDAGGNMYIGVQTTDNDNTSTTRSFLPNVSGIYVWDRLTTVVGNRNFIELPSLKEIKAVNVTPDNEVVVIGINNDRQTELWKINQSRGVLVKQLGSSAYPEYRRAVTMINKALVWLGADGKIYAYGKTAEDKPYATYIIGDASTQTANTFTSGILVNGDEPSSGQRQALFLSWTDDTTDKMSKWYPHGEGTIDSVTQNPHIGNIYTPVQLVAPQSQIDRFVVTMLPNTGSGDTTAANLKIYFNQSTTPWATKSITHSDIAKGYKIIDVVGSVNTQSYQFEVEYVDTETIGTSEFNPIYVQVDYVPEGRNNG